MVLRSSSSRVWSSRPRDEVEQVRDGRAGVPGTVWYDTV